MKIIRTQAGPVFGPFSEIETLDDRYRADGIEYGFEVVGPSTVEDQGDWLPPAPAIPDSEFNAAIDAQIADLEHASLMPRFIREYALSAFVQAAQAHSITVQQLLDPNNPAYSAGFYKVYALDQQIAALRRSRR